VLAITAVVGLISIVDLRLLGLASMDRAADRLAHDVLPLTWIAFALAAPGRNPASRERMKDNQRKQQASGGGARRGWSLAAALDRGGRLRSLDRLHLALAFRFHDNSKSDFFRSCDSGMPIIPYQLGAGVFLALAVAAGAVNAEPAQKAAAGKKPATVINPPPTARDWADLAKLPDWSGVWNPKVTDQDAQVKTNPPPWTPQAAAQIEKMFAEEKAGRPAPIFVNCLPEAMPSWMLVTHNAMEFLFTPGRVTILGESDGNRLRRIYTDGRGHPDDEELTFHGHSIGHWEGDTLVVDTVNVLPQTYLAVSEAAGVPNNGDMKIVERIRLAEPDVLHDDLEILAPKILTRPWKTTRIFFRQRARKFDIVEGVCLQGSYSERVDADGNHVFVAIERHPWGNLVAPKR
jgi:hypothetical protein